jgi:hypothetical protein
MNHDWKIRWHIYLSQLLSACLGLVIFFAFWYWMANTCNWGQILNREGHQETQFAEFLYFSIGTFFRIGYGDQIPVGINRWIAGIEAFSNYAVEIIFMARLVTNFLSKFVMLSIRDRLETLLNYYE